jgi:hypothetical protein
MQALRQIATFYRAALLLGIVSGDDVIAWADGVIARDADASAQLIDLSMIPPSDLSELRHALQPLTAETESLAILRALFDRARSDLESGRRGAKDTITVLYQARSLLALPADMSDDVALLQNDFMLANAGVIGNADAVIARLHAWIAPFAGSEAAFFEEQTC